MPATAAVAAPCSTTLAEARGALARVGTVVPHTDADGLAAGAIALRWRGEDAATALLLPRGATPFGPAPPLPSSSVAVLDWGIRPLARPGLLVDHHVPEWERAPGQVVVSGHGESPEPSTSVLMRRLVPEAPAWLAAVGAFGDLGAAGLARPECAGAPRGAVRRLTPLVNAPRRVPDGPVRSALALLVESDTPAAALADPRLAVLEECRAEWRSELVRVLRTAPRVADDVALVRFSSPCLVHPLVAETWKRRLSPRVVIAANDGYLPGRVNFAVRGGSGDLRALLRAAAPGLGGEFAHGHTRATGGSVSPEDFESLMQVLGP
jgi:single-stranded-DNA-specific exonuclease